MGGRMLDSNGQKDKELCTGKDDATFLIHTFLHSFNGIDLGRS